MAMDRAENIAYQYLMGLFSDVVHEPDGSVPPDFLVDGALAVEVRRLNQNYSRGTATKGLENDYVRLEMALRGVLKTFDRATEDQAYWVCFSLQRPLGNLKRIKSNARKRLSAFLDQPATTPFDLTLARNVTITLMRADKPHSRTFRIAMGSDRDSGGFAADLYIRNIQHCVNEKTAKVSPYQKKYPRWWFILVDCLGLFSPDDPEDVEELETVTNALGRPSTWESLLVITPAPIRKLIQL